MYSITAIRYSESYYCSIVIDIYLRKLRQGTIRRIQNDRNHIGLCSLRMPSGVYICTTVTVSSELWPSGAQWIAATDSGWGKRLPQSVCVRLHIPGKDFDRNFLDVITRDLLHMPGTGHGRFWWIFRRALIHQIYVRSDSFLLVMWSRTLNRVYPVTLTSNLVKFVHLIQVTCTNNYSVSLSMQVEQHIDNSV